MKNLLNLAIQYLLKGGLLQGANTYILPQIRNYVRTTLQQLVVQVIVLAGILFLIDYVLPRLVPQLFEEQPELPQLPAAEGGLGGMLQGLLGQAAQPQPQVAEGFRSRVRVI